MTPRGTARRPGGVDSAAGAKVMFPLRALAAGIALTAVLFLSETWAIWHTYSGARRLATTELRLRQLAGTILHHDEGLTMSARMAAATGDLAWEARYWRFQPELDAALAEATALAPEAAIVSSAGETSAADAALMVIEVEAFALVRAGERERAAALLTGEAYERQKAIYEAGMRRSIDAVLRRSAEQLEAMGRRVLGIIGVALALVAGLGACWTRIVGLIRDYLRARDAAEAALTEANATLERRVDERTAELDHRNGAMRLVLDNVNQGLVVLGRDGVVGGECSAAVHRWFGPAVEGKTFWSYLEAADPKVAAWFELGWGLLVEGEVPHELALDQLPKALSIGPIALEFDYRLVGSGGEGEASRLGGGLDKVLVVISDVTTRLERERSELDQKELLAFFENLLKDRAGASAFCAEADALVHAIVEPGAVDDDYRRNVHTLKGNCGVYGMGRLVAICHELESHLSDEGDVPTMLREQLSRRWQETRRSIGRLIGHDEGRLEVDDIEHQAVVRALSTGAPRQQILAMLARWRDEPLRPRLGHIAEQARALALRLGKGEICATVESAPLRLPADPWRGFWSSFVHLVRNAVDHGLEPGDERRALGKPPVGHLVLRAGVEPEGFVIEIADDGRGIDWGAVARRARAERLPAVTADDLTAALFHDGISTRDEASEHSGRGVGLGAVRAACARLGGRVEVHSAPGRGTSFRFVFSPQAVSCAAPEPEPLVERALLAEAGGRR